MPAEVVIETRNLTKVYRDFWGRQKVRALKALDLEVRRGLLRRQGSYSIGVGYASA